MTLAPESPLRPLHPVLPLPCRRLVEEHGHPGRVGAHEGTEIKSSVGTRREQEEVRQVSLRTRSSLFSSPPKAFQIPSEAEPLPGESPPNQGEILDQRPCKQG